MPITFTIHGAPRTKKNHGRIVTVRGRPRMLPSPQWEAWVQQAYMQPHPGLLEDRPYNVRAAFYRDARRGDAVGYYQGLADLLQHARVVSDDKWLVSWDGSRMLVDGQHPRVVVTLEPVTGD